VAHAGVSVAFDLADQAGYSYYTGSRFAVYAKGSSDALLRGGRYDEVGAVFGRNRPAVGFSTDLKQLPLAGGGARRHAAVRAPWSEDAGLRAAVRALRAGGDTVVCVLPGHEHEVQEFECDREIVAVDGQWVLRAL
jgi:ATP phosphoribosyltransferase regulatory subunit